MEYATFGPTMVHSQLRIDEGIAETRSKRWCIVILGYQLLYSSANALTSVRAPSGLDLILIIAPVMLSLLLFRNRGG